MIMFIELKTSKVYLLERVFCFIDSRNTEIGCLLTIASLYKFINNTLSSFCLTFLLKFPFSIKQWKDYNNKLQPSSDAKMLNLFLVIFNI